MNATLCTVCGCKILDAPSVSCPRCETPHHAECWEYNGGCGIYACNPATRAVLASKPTRAGAGVWAAPAVMALGLLVGGLGFWRYQTLRLENSATTPPRSGSPRQASPRVDPETTREPPTGRVGTSVGDVAPDFDAPDLSGVSRSLTAIRRGRAAVLTFWLAGCADCMPFVPDWAKIYTRYEENSDLVLVNVAAFAHDAQGIRRFCAEQKIGGRVLLDGANRAVPTYGVNTLTAFVIDPQGVIRYRGSGAEAGVEPVERALRTVLPSR